MRVGGTVLPGDSVQIFYRSELYNLGENFKNVVGNTYEHVEKMIYTEKRLTFLFPDHTISHRSALVQKFVLVLNVNVRRTLKVRRTYYTYKLVSQSSRALIAKFLRVIQECKL